MSVEAFYDRYANHGRAMISEREWIVRYTLFGNVEYWQCSEGVEVRKVEKDANVYDLPSLPLNVGGRPRKVLVA